MLGSAHEKALQHIEYAQQNYSGGKDLPVEMLVQAGICHAHLGNMEKAEPFFSVFTHVAVNDYSRLIIEAADSLVSLKHHGSALKYYLMLEGNDGVNKVLLYLKIRRCYSFLSSRTQTINCFYKGMIQISSMDTFIGISKFVRCYNFLTALHEHEDNISVLSPPSDSESRIGETSGGKKTLVILVHAIFHFTLKMSFISFDK
ncbi:hypothetical protein L2E82_01638 [Cichorium intybus]|uniref:Uncharacterized protein n=1 Tax=Cichorium intybus TaxID=13427 RepID=A0ACB9GZ37_CICIN|nr:hypothetical protein L2E82_01638 [Cichorium intybus]